jgi:hypothetical protein
MKGTIAFSGTSTEYTIIGYEYNFIGKNVMYNLSFTTGIPIQYVIMVDWIQLSSSLDSSSSKSVRHCELNPIELIWAQVKGFVAEKIQLFV